MPSPRAALLSLVPGVVLMLSWLRLEHPQADGWRAVALLVLAVVPALAPRGWQRLALLGVAVAVVREGDDLAAVLGAAAFVEAARA